MRWESTIVRVERGAIRWMPSSVVMLGNASIHRFKGEPELRELPRLVAPGSCAIDVGAHFGTYSHALCRLVGKHGRVISVEPIEEDAHFLAAAARQLRLPMEVHNCALSAEARVADLHIPNLHGHQKTALSSLEARDSVAQTRKVTVKRLDDLLEGVEQPVSFIKIDVEGHESAVLDGASETIARHRPNLLIEIEGRFLDHPVADTIDRVLAMGYRGEFLNATGQRRPVSEFRPELHQDAAAHDALSREYISNFIFTPA